MSELKQCGNCAFFDRDGFEDPTTGRCRFADAASRGSVARDEDLHFHDNNWCGSWQPKSWREMPTAEFKYRTNTTPLDLDGASQEMIDFLTKRFPGHVVVRPASGREKTFAEALAELKARHSHMTPRRRRAFKEAERMIQERGCATIGIVSALVSALDSLDHSVSSEEEE